MSWAEGWEDCFEGPERVIIEYHGNRFTQKADVLHKVVIVTESEEIEWTPTGFTIKSIPIQGPGK